MSFTPASGNDRTFPAADMVAVKNYIMKTFGVSRRTAHRAVNHIYDNDSYFGRKFSVHYRDGTSRDKDTISVHAR